MTHRSVGRIVLPLLVLALTAYASAAASGKQPRDSGSSTRLDESPSNLATAGDAQTKGRYKKEGDNCVWDGNDSGPDQCQPQTKGRFKKAGDNCTWDANDTGADQCRPPKGRWAKVGARCVWRPSDSGPDQCNPRQPR
jgi:hypothetical protein